MPVGTVANMRPFPEALYEACPTQQGLGIILDRPWWRMCFEKPMQGWYMRNDMLLSLATDDLNREIVFGPPWMIGMELHAALAAFDAQHPAKHPGYRAGQVWADEHGSTSVLFRSKELNTMLYPFLVADPVCPHLAPWSPANTVDAP